MKSKKIGICAVQIPFMQGGNERLIFSLHKEFLKRGLNAEVVNIPFKWYPPDRLITECMIWRLIDLSEMDMVIATKFPSTAVKHPDKRTWLVHQYRPAYELYGTEFGNLSFTQEHAAIRDSIKRIDDITIRESTRIFTISANVSGRLKKYNTIDSFPLYPPPEGKERFYHESYGNYILSVGRLAAQKRIPLLIDAFRHVTTDTTCIIAGSGPERERLEQQVHEVGLQGKIRFTGYLQDDEIIKLYANALAVFYAPYDEDYGFATIEAFLSRKPIITTNDAGGVLEFVRDEENGCISGTDPREIAGKIDWISAHKAACSELGANGYAAVKDISWDQVIERLVY